MRGRRQPRNRRSVHVTTVERRYDTVLSIVPPMYADSGGRERRLQARAGRRGRRRADRLAPHVRSFSETHGRAIARAGYHCRDYYLAEPERVAGIPLGVLAHGAHVRGLGTYDAATGTERCRITVTLATGIPREACEARRPRVARPSHDRPGDLGLARATCSSSRARVKSSIACRVVSRPALPVRDAAGIVRFRYDKNTQRQEELHSPSGPV